MGRKATAATDVKVYVEVNALNMSRAIKTAIKISNLTDTDLIATSIEA